MSELKAVTPAESPGESEEYALHSELSSGSLHEFSSRFTAIYRIAAHATSDRF